VPRLLLLLTLTLLLSPATARAWPVDWIHDVETGREKFVRLPKLDWFEVDDPKVVSVEWLDSGELLLVGLKPGRATVLLGAEGKVAAWRVRVGGKSVVDPTMLAAAQQACPGLTLTPLEDVKLTVTVADERCRAALFALFQTDAFEARHLALTFESKVLQAQLKSVQEGLKGVSKKVSARCVGAGLVLEGPVASEADRRRVLWEVLRRSLGRLALDDQLVAPEPLDAGVAEPHP
jgi:hypothetical protein